MTENSTKSGQCVYRRNFIFGATGCFFVTAATTLNQTPTVIPRSILTQRSPIINSNRIVFKKKQVDNVDLHYREVGPRSEFAILLLHGLNTTGHMFRNLMPLLGSRYHLLAPDLPGFGYSLAATNDDCVYNGERIYKLLERFLAELSIQRVVIYGYEYGCAIGFKLARANPNLVNAIISHNGNIYLEGLGNSIAPWKTYWEDPSPLNRQGCAGALAIDDTSHSSTELETGLGRPLPDGYNLDRYFLSLPGMKDIQLDLILDYKNIVADYVNFQSYLRSSRLSLMVLWGAKESYWKMAGAEAYRKDSPSAEIHYFDSCRHLLEEKASEISVLLEPFLAKAQSNVELQRLHTLDVL